MIEYPAKKDLLHFIETKSCSINEDICYTLEVADDSENKIQMLKISPSCTFIQALQLHLLEYEQVLSKNDEIMSM